MANICCTPDETLNAARETPFAGARVRYGTVQQSIHIARIVLVSVLMTTD
jgi:hypothetical protein